MSLTPMSPGGRWMRPPHDAPPVYVPAKQVEAHYKRLVGESWTPIEYDPRKEDQQYELKAQLHEQTQSVANEIAMQSRIEQLESALAKQTELLTQLLAEQKGEHNGSTRNDDKPDSENATDDRRSGKRKPTV